MSVYSWSSRGIRDCHGDCSIKIIVPKMRCSRQNKRGERGRVSAPSVRSPRGADATPLASGNDLPSIVLGLVPVRLAVFMELDPFYDQLAFRVAIFIIL